MTQVAHAPSLGEQVSHGDAAVHGRSRFWVLALGCIGVVYGDIGTSPLYAFRLALAAAGGVTRPAILGVASLALWALIIVVTVKYVLFMMRADNRGEGGVLSLMALAERAIGRRTALIFVLGMLGAALFYGDACITPAISVLSAIEGVRTIPALAPVISDINVLEISLVVLLGLFAIQAGGTSRVSTLFGPLTAVWFVAIAAVGIYRILGHPDVLLALSPLPALDFMLHHGIVGFFVLGAVFLTVTGAEALFADMGHFGRWPIQAAWLFFVLPALMLNYLGQGGFALHTLAEAQAHGRTVGDVDWFFTMTPEVFRIPMVILATIATVIASQAVITGAFSLTQQAMQLGLLPRLTIRNTSAAHSGQIYMPGVNWLLAVGVVFLVAAFKSSAALGNAYGLAVTGTMIVTTTLAFIVARRLWSWKLWLAALFIGPLLAVDLTFLASNALKIPSGGWLPLLIGGGLLLLMGTWVRGTRVLAEKSRALSIPMSDVMPILAQRSPFRVGGVAVFLTSDPDTAPASLLHNLKHNHVFHEHNVILTVRTARTPRVSDDARAEVQRLDENFTRVILTYGFMQQPDIVRDLQKLKGSGLRFDLMTTSFFFGRRSVAIGAASKTPVWQRKLYAFLHRNASDPTAYFNVPVSRVVELGAQVSL